MSELRTYTVIVHRSGQLTVVTSEYEPAPHEVILKPGFRTIDDAFDYRDDMQSRIDMVIKRRDHCAACD